jgi:MFS family permease
MADASAPSTVGPWRPLQSPTFRNLLAADLVADVGTFMQSVGAAWLMISLKSTPIYVALIQTASALPFFVFALPAGAIGDIVDRRKLILFTETWMLLVAIAVAGFTIMGWMSPVLLLILTFALSAGDAFEAPTWRAVLPDVVPQEDLQAASALNGIEFNFARAIGPGLAGFIVAVAGVGTTFVLNAASFIGVIAVIARWKSPTHKRTVPPETVWRGTATGLRYIRYSPAIRKLFLRTGLVTFFATALTALLPLIAHNVSSSPVIFGILLGCFGLGAVVGAVVMQRARARWSAEIVISSGVLIYGLATLAAAAFRVLPLLCAATFVGGAAWIMYISIVNVMILNRSPDWVRARVLSISTLVLQGSVAVGSATWGALASHFGLTVALLWAGAGTVVATALGLVLPLPVATVDVTAWNHWPLPNLDGDSLPAGYDTGPVLVTVEYEVSAENAKEFIKVVRRYGRIRRRDGASRWTIFRDLENTSHYVETFIVSSWGEHLRQHERLTRADREVEEHLQKYVQGIPKVRHLISAATAE